MRTFHDVIQALDSAQASDKGRRFEQFVRAFLRQGFYPERFRSVDRWADWTATHLPQESGKDRGIDFVADDEEGRRWAIQAKHWNRPIAWSDLATFVAEAERPGLHMDQLLVIAPNDLTRDAWDRCRERGVAVYTANDFEQAPVDWDTFAWEEPATLTPRTPATLRPYQAEALTRIQ